ncbi:hypothetical protein BCR35DRAFT_336132 [Leucosporidium creatinivorum]|uniref:XRCC4-like factor-domain-containing protein n=1 Tax=Leucosporidium creatinivorum TaxID=106004 RepID=A0A1Y2CN14_9BASI|nr:hypothetical protein BCR35DRAFT_336132 [Leucosporidium creatinivorum]
MSWQDTLAVVPWACFPSPDSSSPNLLLKVALSRGPAPGLIVLATPDLVQVYYEDVNERNLKRRIGQALDESQETQSQQQGAFGVGEEGEKELRERVEEVLKGIREGEAKVELDRRGSEAILTVSLPSSFTIQFPLDSLEAGSGPFLASQLVTPLLGLSASLVGLLKEESSAQPALASKVQDALDASGTAEYNQEGRSCNTLLRNGGGSMMKRWAQKSRRGQKAKDLEPVSFSTSSSSLSRPALTPQPSASTSNLRDRRRSPSPPPPAPRPSTSPSKALARQILDHRNPTTQGETISWDESQAAPPPRSPKKKAGESPAKGKGKASVLVLGGEEEEEEPATEEDEPMDDASPAFESAPTAAQPPSTKKRPAASMDRSSVSPPPSCQSSFPLSRSPIRSPSPSQSQTEKQDSDDEEDEEARKAREKARAKERKRVEKEKEEQEEREMRALRLKMAAKQAARKGEPPVKRRRD